VPVIGGVDLMSTARSAARRSVTGEPNVITTGCATPTTSSGPGCTATMPKAKDCAEGFGLVAAAWLIPAGPATRLAAIRLTARAHRTATRMSYSCR